MKNRIQIIFLIQMNYGDATYCGYNIFVKLKTPLISLQTENCDSWRTPDILEFMENLPIPSGYAHGNTGDPTNARNGLL